MPHKRNPITTERITGLARVLRGYAQAAVEDVALWHERDISHSGAERVILPDATILLDYMQHLAIRVVRGMVVHEDRDPAQPRAHLRRAVLPARPAGAGRGRDGRATTPTGSSSASPSRRGTRRRRCATLLAAEPAGDGLDLDAIFDYGHYVRHVPEVLERLDAMTRRRCCCAATGRVRWTSSRAMPARRSSTRSSFVEPRRPPARRDPVTSSTTTAASRSPAHRRPIDPERRSVDRDACALGPAMPRGWTLQRRLRGRARGRSRSSASREALVSWDFPVALADRLRADGVDADRRPPAPSSAPARVKTRAQLDGHPPRAARPPTLAMAVGGPARPRGARGADRRGTCARRCRPSATSTTASSPTT